VVTWPTIASLANGAIASHTVTVTAPTTGTLVKRGLGHHLHPDPVAGNSDGSDPSSRVTTTVTEIADLSVVKSGPATVVAATNLGYTVTVTNTARPLPRTSSSPTRLPSSSTFVSASAGGTETDGLVTWPAIASLANGANASYTVTVTAPASGTLENVAAASSPTTDPAPGNNDGSDPGSRVSTTVDTRADIAVTKTGPAGVNAATNFDYTVTITNHGPSTAASVVVTARCPPMRRSSRRAAARARLGRRDVGDDRHAREQRERLVHRHDDGAGPPARWRTWPRDDLDDRPDAGKQRRLGPGEPRHHQHRGVRRSRRHQDGPGEHRRGDQLQLHRRRRQRRPVRRGERRRHRHAAAAVTFVSASNGGVVGLGVVTWPTIGSLANGANVSYTVTVTAPTTGSLLNVAAATSSTADPDAGNNDGSDPTAASPRR